MRCLSCYARVGYSSIYKSSMRIYPLTWYFISNRNKIHFKSLARLYKIKNPTNICQVLNWAMRDLNPRPPQCRCDALPTAPIAQIFIQFLRLNRNALLFQGCATPLTKTILNRFCFQFLLYLGQVTHIAIAVIRYCPHIFEFVRYRSTPLYAKTSRQSANRPNIYSIFKALKKGDTQIRTGG